MVRGNAPRPPQPTQTQLASWEGARLVLIALGIDVDIEPVGEEAQLRMMGLSKSREVPLQLGHLEGGDSRAAALAASSDGGAGAATRADRLACMVGLTRANCSSRLSSDGIFRYVSAGYLLCTYGSTTDAPASLLPCRVGDAV